MKIYIILLLGLFQALTFEALSQRREMDIAMNHRVVLTFPDRLVYADIITTEKTVNPDLDRYYYWFKSNDIKKTRGGFDGKLLHGTYMEFYPDKNLKEKGLFRFGLKSGLWKTWYVNGELASLVKWKKGKMRGEFRFFDENGKLLKEGCYRNDAFHGRINTYLPGGKVESCMYKSGEKLEKKDKWYKRIFKSKKNKSAEKAEPANDKPEYLNDPKNKIEENRNSQKQKKRKKSESPIKN